MPTNEASFTISLIGEVTQERWAGSFKCKTRLSHRDFLAQDSIRRNLLGSASGDPSPRAASIADVFSALGVRITDAPSWWTNSGGGMDLADDSVVAAIYKECIAAQKSVEDELKKKAEEAKTELKKD